jgi:phosphoglycerate dehydrogenase-like enzyme
MSTTKTLPRLATSKLNVGIIGFGVVGAATANGLKSLGNQIYISRRQRSNFFLKRI